MNRILTFLVLGAFISCARSSKIEALFSDMSIGVPEYQSIEKFNHPMDAAKGDYFSVDFVQSSNQLKRLITKMGLTETDVLSSGPISPVSVASKINLNHPWFLSVKAEAIHGMEKSYRVRIEGIQPFD